MIERVPVLAAEDEDERSRFAAEVAIVLEAAVFPPEEVLFRKGDCASTLYFIAKVGCGVWGGSEGGASVTIARESLPV